MIYFIYQHIRLDTNQIFYIGKGTKQKKGICYKRAYTKSSRNQYWKNITNKISYKVEILEEFETETECLEKETELIRKYGYSWNNTGILCNIVEDNSEIRELGRKKSLNKIKKAVYQYDEQGNYLKCFPSIKDAIKEYPSDIYNAASGRHKSAGGFQWRLEKYDKLEPYSTENTHIQNSKIVLQFDTENNFIQEWYGTKIPSETLKIHRSAIRNCLAGISKTAGGFKWKHKNK